MSKTNLCSSRRDKELNYIIGMISGGCTMNGIDKKELSKKTGIAQRTVYARFENPESIRLGELIDMCNQAGVRMSFEYKEKMYD